MNYVDLCANIASICENTFTADEYAMFTQQAEQKIYNMVQPPALRKEYSTTCTINVESIALPTDFLYPFSISVVATTGEHSFLLDKDVNYIRQAYPLPTDTAIPKYYALFGPSYSNSDELSFILGPTPDAAYSMELHYFFYPDSITVAADGRTWLGDNFDTVLLYGSLVEAYIFMKGEVDIITMYETKYKEALALAQRLGDGLERSDAYRSGQYRQAPLPQNNGVR
jgi:hypothetical protein